MDKDFTDAIAIKGLITFWTWTACRLANIRLVPNKVNAETTSKALACIDPTLDKHLAYVQCDTAQKCADVFCF